MEDVCVTKTIDEQFCVKLNGVVSDSAGFTGKHCRRTVLEVQRALQGGGEFAAFFVIRPRPDCNLEQDVKYIENVLVAYPELAYSVILTQVSVSTESGGATGF